MTKYVWESCLREEMGGKSNCPSEMQPYQQLAKKKKQLLRILKPVLKDAQEKKYIFQVLTLCPSINSPSWYMPNTEYVKNIISLFPSFKNAKIFFVIHLKLRGVFINIFNQA